MTVEEAVFWIFRARNDLADKEGGQRLLHAARQYYHSQRHCFGDDFRNELETEW